MTTQFKHSRPPTGHVFTDTFEHRIQRSLPGGGVSLESLFEEVWRASSLPDGTVTSWAGENGVYTLQPTTAAGGAAPTKAGDYVDVLEQQGLETTEAGLAAYGGGGGASYTMAFAFRGVPGSINVASDFLYQLGQDGAAQPYMATLVGGGYIYKNDAGVQRFDTTAFTSSDTKALVTQYDASTSTYRLWLEGVLTLSDVDAVISTAFTFDKLELGISTAFNNDATYQFKAFAVTPTVLTEDQIVDEVTPLLTAI